MVLGPAEIAAAFAGSLASAWWLLFMKYGRQLETMETDAELIELIPEDQRTIEQKLKLKLWQTRQSFLQKYKYRLLSGMGAGIGTALFFIGAFMNDPVNEGVSIIGAVVAGALAGLAGTAVTAEVRATK